MNASRIQAHACDGVVPFSLRDETRVPTCPGGFRKLSPAVGLQDLMIALVALLVALVHQRGSYSVTCGNRTRMCRSLRQMRASFRRSVTKRDCDGQIAPGSGLKVWGPRPA
jgi:hypothetical protein